jgi:hypothetical protein
MRLLDIVARAHRDGNRIDLSWTNPDPVAFPGMRVVRREGTHPVGPNDGFVVAQDNGLVSVSDVGLKGETVYYYGLFPFRGAPPQFDVDRANRASALATAPYGFGDLLYGRLPALYHRYDEARLAGAASLPAADRDKGPLRRFLDLPGAQLDQIYSLVRTALHLCDVDRVEGSLLPLLAQWIGWFVDYQQEVGAQRNELRFAPALYQTIGLVPTVEATVKRISTWECRTKEYVQNVARTNQPERLNLWFALRGANGTFAAPALASVNAVHEGRPAAVRESDGSVSFFYHALRKHGWDIWTKRFAAGQWQPSAPVIEQPGIDKHPSVAMQGNRLWLFWESCDPTQAGNAAQWRINFSIRSGATWSAPAVFGDAATARRMPAAVADATGGVWLFWCEQTPSGWRVRYSRHDGTNWLPAPVDLPPDGAADPRVEADLIVLFHPTSASQRLWLFWARHEAGGPPGQTRWTIAYRIKQGLDPAVSDWSSVRLLPKAAAADHDREPAPILASGGNIELFWSSSRAGGWTLWRAVLDIATLALGAAQQIAATPFSNRAPQAVDTGNGTLLTFRSNESMAHTSAVYGATRTLDTRGAGTTTVDVRNLAKQALRGQFEDFQGYTYDSGQSGVRTNNDRVARDTIGLFLTPPAGTDAATIQAMLSRLANVVPEFMPITERAVFITP